MSMAIDEMKCSIREEKAFSIAKNLLQLPYTPFDRHIERVV